jgi:2-phosphosulfolactate phosphatase
MKIKIILSADRIIEDEIEEKTVIAIDTFRATTTIVTALAHGAQEVIPVSTINEAINYHNSGKNLIKAGERNGEKLSDMDLGNSPLSYREEIVKDKQIILTTTNGTRMLLNLEKAKKIIIASLLNLEAVARKVKKEEQLIISCAGTQNKFSLEDFITAGALIYRLKRLKLDLELTDLNLIAYQSYLMNKGDLAKILYHSRNGARLISLGKKSDIDYALNEDCFSLTPVYSEGSIDI